MGKWIAVIFMIIAGILIVIYTEQIMRFTGRVTWAEQHLGPEGGSRLFIKLVGLAFILVALLVATGIMGDIITAIFGSGRLAS